MRKTCAQAIMDCLAISGVDHVFGIASGKMMPLLRVLSKQNEIRFMGVRHETSAAMMASGFYFGTGRLACAFGELGPGSGNLVPGVANAWADNLPMIVITTGNPLHLSYPSRGMLMELELLELFRPITKSSLRLHDGRRAPELVFRAVREALSGCPGPVHLNVPADILAREFPYDPAAFVPESRGRMRSAHADPKAIEEAATLLQTAERPLILAGGGVMHADAGPLVVRLAELLKAPATSTQMGLGAIPSDHASFIGHGGVIGGDAVREALGEADVILAAGCRFSSWFWGANGTLIGDRAQIIQIDINPEALGRNIPSAIPIHSDARSALSALINELEAAPPRPSNDWLPGLTARFARYRASFENPSDPDGLPSPAALAAALNEMLPDNALVTYDGGHTSFWHNDILSAPATRTRFHAPGMAQLGFGLPYALALQAAFPERPVICTTGDGSAGFTIQELDTARRHDLPVLCIVHNNAAWGIIQAGQKKAGFELETDLSGTDYAAIARGFGIAGHRVESLNDFRRLVREALEARTPTLLDCKTHFAPHPGMKAFGAAASPPDPDCALPF